MAITVGTVTSTDASSASPSFSHTVEADTKALILSASYFGSDPASAATLDGAAATLGQRVGSTPASAELWIVLNPSAGARTVAWNFPAGSRRCVIGAMDLLADGALSLGTPASATGTSTGPTVDVASAAGQLVVGVCGIQIGTSTVSLTVGAGQTERVNRERVGSSATNGHRGAVSTEAGASTVTTSFTRGDSDDWVVLAYPVIETLTAGPAHRRLLTMGLG